MRWKPFLITLIAGAAAGGGLTALASFFVRELQPISLSMFVAGGLGGIITKYILR
jgi:hypothetical protein